MAPHDRFLYSYHNASLIREPKPEHIVSPSINEHYGVRARPTSSQEIIVTAVAFGILALMFLIYMLFCCHLWGFYRKFRNLLRRWRGIETVDNNDEPDSVSRSDAMLELLDLPVPTRSGTWHAGVRSYSYSTPPPQYSAVCKAKIAGLNRLHPATRSASTSSAKPVFLWRITVETSRTGILTDSRCELPEYSFAEGANSHQRRKSNHMTPFTNQGNTAFRTGCLAKDCANCVTQSSMSVVNNQTSLSNRNHGSHARSRHVLNIPITPSNMGGWNLQPFYGPNETCARAARPVRRESEVSGLQNCTYTVINQSFSPNIQILSNRVGYGHSASNNFNRIQTERTATFNINRRTCRAKSDNSPLDNFNNFECLNRNKFRMYSYDPEMSSKEYEQRLTPDTGYITGEMSLDFTSDDVFIDTPSCYNKSEIPLSYNQKFIICSSAAKGSQHSLVENKKAVAPPSCRNDIPDAFSKTHTPMSLWNFSISDITSGVLKKLRKKIDSTGSYIENLRYLNTRSLSAEALPVVHDMSVQSEQQSNPLRLSELCDGEHTPFSLSCLDEQPKLDFARTRFSKTENIGSVAGCENSNSRDIWVKILLPNGRTSSYLQTRRVNTISDSDTRVVYFDPHPDYSIKACSIQVSSEQSTVEVVTVECLSESMETLELYSYGQVQ